ncbi:MAG: hypothetical protein JSW21_02900 [Gammaproteobacteria bacterium]|nr:MAG: hypothetical protein JSW21_02900 [Gammaproteobacteria bacterium]
MPLFDELRRRSVASITMVYLATSRSILNIAGVLPHPMQLPSVWTRGVLAE